MSRIPALAPLLALLVAPAWAPAQETAQAGREVRFIRESLYRVGFADLEEWNRIYREQLVPVLEGLEEEGRIEGWSAASHHSGGPYNWRFTLRFYDWPSVQAGVDSLVARLGRTAPEGTLETIQRLNAGHRDEIWESGGVRLSEDLGGLRYVYQATYQVEDLGAWEELFRRRTEPVLEELREQGLLLGWVVHTHGHGGPHNWQILYFFEEWDSMDDFFQGLFARLGERDPEGPARAGELIRSHHDNIWSPVPREGS